MGCTRFGTNPAGGPFTRKPKTIPDPYSPNPPGPAVTNSPLALAAPTPSTPGVMPAGASATAEQPLPRRRPDPATGQPPSPSTTGAVTPPVSAAEHLAEVKRLVEAATAKWKTVDCYEAMVTRRTGTQQEAERGRGAVPVPQGADGGLHEERRRIGQGSRCRTSRASTTTRSTPSSGRATKTSCTRSAEGRRSHLGSASQKAKTRYSIREAGHGTPIARLNGWVARAEPVRFRREPELPGRGGRNEFPHSYSWVQPGCGRTMIRSCPMAHSAVVLRAEEGITVILVSCADHRDSNPNRAEGRVLPIRENEPQGSIHRRGLRPDRLGK